MDTNTLTVMGDSIAVGIGDPVPGYPDIPWSDQLAAMLTTRPMAPPRNLGVVGARMVEIVDAQLETAVDQPADVTVLTGGGNDILGQTIDWESLERLLDVAVARLGSTDTTVVTFGLFDVTCTELVPERYKTTMRSRIERLNALTASVTERHGGCFVDFFDHPEQSAALFSADGLHPNRRAHQLIATEVYRQLTS